MRTHKLKFLVAVPLVFSMVTGCSTINPYTNTQESSNATTGSIIGAFAGAAIGAATGGGRGALIGLASGAAIGGTSGYYMDVQEAKLRQQLQATGVSVTREGQNIVLNMSNDITFGVNQSNLKTPAKQILNSVFKVAEEYKNTDLHVIGYTDNTGSASYNKQLSTVRSANVANYLMQIGLNPVRIKYYGMGEQHPIASNSTHLGRSENRRVEIILSPIQQ